MQCHSFLGAKMRKEIYEMYRFRYMDKKPIYQARYRVV
jgi:hypothetical protein